MEEMGNESESQSYEQSLIFQFHVMFKDCSFLKKLTQIYPEKKNRKRTNKGKNNSNEPDSQSHDTTIYCP